MGTLIALRHANINKELVIAMNDAGTTFDGIADYLDRNEIRRINRSTNNETIMNPTLNC